MALYTGNTNALMQMASSPTQMASSMMQAGMGVSNLKGIGMGYGPGGYGPGGGSSLAYDGLSPGMTHGPLAVSPPAAQLPPGVPFVIPNPFDNTIIVKGTGQEIDQIKELISGRGAARWSLTAKIYEVDLDNELAEGAESYLKQFGSPNATSVTGNTNTTNGLNTISGLALSQERVVRHRGCLGAYVGSHTSMSAITCSFKPCCGPNRVAATKSTAADFAASTSIRSAV